MRAHAANGSPHHDLLAEHQREAFSWVVSTIEHFGGAILADDVGMGKTRVAAAVASHYASAGRVELVIPPGIAAHWERTLDLFGVRGTLVSRHQLEESSTSSPPALVVVDEAHFFRNRATRGWRMLVTRCRGVKVLLLTATPFWNRARDVESLVSIFARDGDFRCSGIVSISDGFHRRNGTDPRPVLGSVMLARTRAGAGFTTPAPIERRVIDVRASMSDVACSKALDDLEFPLVDASSRASLVRMFLRLRLCSSGEAFVSSLRRQRRFIERATVLMKRGFRVTRTSTTTSRDLVHFQDLLFPDLFDGIDRTEAVELDELHRELAVIQRIESSFTPSHTRFARLLAILRSRPSATIIFCRATETVGALERFLAARGVTTATVSSRHSAVAGRPQDRAATITAFADGKVDVLITTDTLGEGWDLRRAERVVHYDLPWSPVRLHQREGRAWRYDRSASEIEAIAFRVCGLGVDVDSILRRKERELEETLVRSATRGEALPSDHVGTRRVPGLRGAIMEIGGRVVALDLSGRVAPLDEVLQSVDPGAATNSDGEAEDRFIRWFEGVQEGRARLPSRGEGGVAPRWSSGAIRSLLVGDLLDPDQ